LWLHSADLTRTQNRPSTRDNPSARAAGLPQLYGYMLANRRKVIGGGSAKKAKAA